MNVPARPWRVWFRPPGKRQRWRRVGAYATRPEAWAAVVGAGDWLIREGDADPNHDRRPWQ